MRLTYSEDQGSRNTYQAKSPRSLTGLGFFFVTFQNQAYSDFISGAWLSPGSSFLAPIRQDVALLSFPWLVCCRDMGPRAKLVRGLGFTSKVPRGTSEKQPGVSNPSS